MRRMIAAGPPSKRPPHIAFAGGGFAGGLASFGTLLLVLLLVLSGGVAADDAKIKLGEFIPSDPPQPAPEVVFADLDGKTVRLDDFLGKPLIVNLWATWCQPCVREMPSLQRLQAQFDGKLVVAAVSEDRGGAKLVTPFIAEHDLKKLKVYLDPKSELGHAFEVRGLPTSIVINAKGRVVGRLEGAAEWDSDKILSVLKPLIEPPEPNPLKKAMLEDEGR